MAVFRVQSIQTNSDSKNVKTLQTSIDKLSGLMDLAMDEMLFWEHQDSATTLVEVDLNDILEEYLPSQILGSIRGRGSLVPDQESWLENILQEFEKEWAHTSVPRTIAEMTLALHMPPNTAAASSRSSRNSSKGKKKPLRISWTHR